MLTITVEFLHGLVRSTPADDGTLAGQPPTGEWPPSPARLHAAFVAADGTGDRCRVTNGTIGIELLESPPRIVANALRDVPMSPLRERFVVLDKTEPGGVQNYPARKSATARGGLRLSPRDPRVAYLWDDAEPTQAQLDGLTKRAARIPYFGCADSPVRVRVHTAPVDLSGLATWEPADDGDGVVSVAYPGLVDLLDGAFADWSQGSPRRRSWLPPQLVRYRTPDAPRLVAPSPITVWVRFDRPVDGRKIVAVTETLRAAVLDRFDTMFGGPDAIPIVIHGHHPPGTRGVEHVRWLGLPHAGFPHADGRIRGACVWLPPDTPGEVTEKVRQCLSSITELVRPGVFAAGIELFDGTRNPFASNPLRWVGPAREWVSVFPVIHERHTKGQLSLPEVTRWCRHAGLPGPVSFESSPVPFVAGAASLPPHLVHRTGQSVSRRYSHLRLRFAEAISGPVVVGGGRHFGLGLMAPQQLTAASDA